MQFVEIEGPLHDQTSRPRATAASSAPWSRSPRRSPATASASRSYRTTPRPTPEKVLRAFAGRAFRRNVTDADLKPFLNLVKAKLAAKHSFEKAVRVGLTAIMVSPDFLFLRETPGKLDDFALASRLSYFLWSTMPDEELLALAEAGKLSRPETLRAGSSGC